MPVLIVILAHNNLALTRKCLTSALAQQYRGVSYPVSGPDDRHFGVMVIDNASTDNTPQWLQSQAPTLRFSSICLPSRLSVAACWNYILEWAYDPINPNRYDGVLILNNDTEIRPDTLTWLMKDPALFVTGISVRSESELGFPSPPTSRRPHPDFSCFMIKPGCWRKVGRFDECFKIAFYEDNSYHLRMHFAGIQAIGIDLPFLHHGSQTVKRADKTEQRMIQRAAAANKEIFRDMWGCTPDEPAYAEIFKS